MNKKGLERLGRAAELIYEQEAAAFRGIRQKAATLEAEIADLRARIPSSAGDGQGWLLAAHAAERWRLWRDERVAELLRQRAALAADEDQCRARTSRALGRVTLLRRLSEEARRHPASPPS